MSGRRVPRPGSTVLHLTDARHRGRPCPGESNAHPGNAFGAGAPSRRGNTSGSQAVPPARARAAATWADGVFDADRAALPGPLARVLRRRDVYLARALSPRTLPDAAAWACAWVIVLEMRARRLAASWLADGAVDGAAVENASVVEGA